MGLVGADEGPDMRRLRMKCLKRLNHAHTLREQLEPHM